MDRAPTTDDLQGPASVSQLTWWIRELVEGGIPPVWVEGELGRFTQHRSGHWYFNLRDSDATISCAMFRGANRHVSWRPREGQQVLVFGRVGVYPPRGNYQLIVERMQPAGHGARQLALARLKARLAGEGLFATERKRPLPRFPRTIGVATSATGAALRDILKVLRRRAPAPRRCPRASPGR